MIGVNHLGHMLLVMELKDILFKSGSKDDPSRLIVTSGDIYKSLIWKNNLPKLENEDSWNRIWNILNKNVYKGHDAYSMSKLCNIWFTKQFAKKYCINNNNNNCIAVVLHPGVGPTDLMVDRNENGERIYSFMRKIVKKVILPIFSLISDNMEQLAYTQCYLSITNKYNLINGEYYRGTKIAYLRDIAKNDEYSKKMWDISVQIIQTVIPNYKVL